MIDGHSIDAVFTDDESELVTIINGLEEQAIDLESRIDKTKNAANLMLLGSGTFFGMYLLEGGTFGRYEHLTFSSLLAIGGIERLVKGRKLEKSILSKNFLATQLKQELEPTDLERYEERDEIFFEEDDEDYGNDDYLFT